MGFPISNFTHAFLSKDMDEFANDGAIQYSSFAKQKKNVRNFSIWLEIT